MFMHLPVNSNYVINDGRMPLALRFFLNAFNDICFVTDHNPKAIYVHATKNARQEILFFDFHRKMM